MLARCYTAKDEFELYGKLQSSLSDADFSEKYIRMLCFSQEGTTWRIVDELSAESGEVSGPYYQEMRQTHFVFMLVPKDKEISMFGQSMSLWGNFENGWINIREFEDLKPNADFMAFEERELKMSATFLKAILRGKA